MCNSKVINLAIIMERENERERETDSWPAMAHACDK